MYNFTRGPIFDDFRRQKITNAGMQRSMLIRQKIEKQQHRNCKNEQFCLAF
jgi:hypothetical protein